MHTFFDRTLKVYDITGKKLAEVSGYSTTHISDFRRGKTNPSVKTLDELLNAADQIAPGAKRYFCQQLAGGSVAPVELAIDNLSSADLARLLIAIGDRLQNQQVLISA